MHERREFSTLGLSGGPMSRPPVTTRIDSPVASSSSRQYRYAARSSGTYWGPSEYARRMMRVDPCEEPNACGTVNCSRPSTLQPLRASW